MTLMKRFDPTTLEIYRALFTSVAEEMGVALYKRDELFATTKLQTPCIVTEYSATTLIDADSKARIDEFGNLLIELQ